MLNADRLFQTLLSGIMVDLGHDDDSVGAELDVDSFTLLPFLTHRSLVAADLNGPEAHSVSLTVNLFLDPSDTPFEWVERLHAAIWRWDSAEMTGIVPGVGGVEEIRREIAAFDRVTSGAQMLGKEVTQYIGTWELTVRKL